MMCIRPEEGRYEMHIDDTMARVSGIGTPYTPAECCDYCKERVHPDYLAYVRENIRTMMQGGKSVQLEFPWLHPRLGDVMIRFSGRRAKDTSNTIVLEGYCRVITDVVHA
jgi:hypothetical protein